MEAQVMKIDEVPRASQGFKEEGVPCLYILLRADLASMTPGKAAAQAAHAANHLTHNWDHTKYGIDWWLHEANGFGTTITLSADEQDCLTLKQAFRNSHACDCVIDPSYPIEDGDVIHQISLITCAYIFIKNKNDLLDPGLQYVNSMALYTGSRYQKMW